MQWLLVGLAALLAIGAAAAQRPLAPGVFVKRTAASGTRSWVHGGVTATLTASDKDDAAKPVITVHAPHKVPLQLAIEDGLARYDTYVGIGVLARGAAPAVIVRGWTGGAHCCTHLIVIEPHRTGFRAIDFGKWDDDVMAWPRDLDGDGVADFVLADRAFISAFSCVACSWLPPLVMTMRDGKAIEVPTKRAFRPLFFADRIKARISCFARGDAFLRDACAGFLADSARLGQFDAAWAELGRARIGWNGRLPVGGTDDFAETVRAFLREHGYIR